MIEIGELVDGESRLLESLRQQSVSQVGALPAVQEIRVRERVSGP
ncbi:hypothetical protein [Streptomyces sp. NPDC058373]